jgi:DMSO/TMAO reductase YedYZ molybdopterin-dependent catalytic subunit
LLLSRRVFLERSAALGPALWRLVDSSAQTVRPPGLEGRRMVRVMPLGRFDGRPVPPLDRLLGTGLDARLFTDLSNLSEDALLITNARFFIRTSAGPQVVREPWSLQVGGRVKDPTTLRLDGLGSLAKPVGTYLIECSGNSDPANFGLISAADWTGAPLAAVLDHVQPLGGSWRIRVTGMDHSGPARSSVAGAAWVFTREEIERSGAFLATAMNGAPLPPDHGFPVRLIVPGWYGCACIKWVSQIDLVPDDEPATSQMKEFAARTHQQGAPELARDYSPAVIDLAATPIRVEQWSSNGGRSIFLVVGIMWGGSKPTDQLAIRFKHNQPFVRVSHCPLPTSTRTWTIWSHLWQPESPGRFQIVLRSTDPAIRARRLDLFAYTREVEVDEI